MKICVVILTKNEEKHIGRALASVASFADLSLVVDSGSGDRTKEIALACGAVFLEHPWVNYATQFNWALSQIPEDIDWVFRLDADEVVSENLQLEISNFSLEDPKEIYGVYIPRRMAFLGKAIHWGGVFPVKVLRFFRNKHGRCENRWMDEHIVVDGPCREFGHELIDNNLNNLTWWTEKHNSYASREVIDILNLEYNFLPHDSISRLRSSRQAEVKRWIKENVYASLPLGARAFLYFCYRFFFRLGFLDGVEGIAFHFFQGFWYRFLVDAKYWEVKKHMKHSGDDVRASIVKVLNIDPSVF